MVLGSKKILNASKPRFSDLRGRTWDSVTIYLLNGQLIKGALDTTWGRWVYFYYNGKWYKISVNEIRDSIISNVIDLREGLKI